MQCRTCSFFGSSKLGGYCSVCYKTHGGAPATSVDSSDAPVPPTPATANLIRQLSRGGAGATSTATSGVGAPPVPGLVRQGSKTGPGAPPLARHPSSSGASAGVGAGVAAPEAPPALARHPSGGAAAALVRQLSAGGRARAAAAGAGGGGEGSAASGSSGASKPKSSRRCAAAGCVTSLNPIQREIKCACKASFCNVHRRPEKHACPVDFVDLHKQRLMGELAKVDGSDHKFERLDDPK